MKRILYISSGHATLEYDDLNLFTELGYDWFSTGHYRDPINPTSIIRPPINKIADPSLDHDIIFISNDPVYLKKSWPLIKHKKVIYRSHDEHTQEIETLLKSCQKGGMVLVRMFEWEDRLPFSAKSDEVISHYVDSTIYQDWSGEDLSILTFQNDFLNRLTHVDKHGIQVYECYLTYLKVIQEVKFNLYGLNTKVAYFKDAVSWEEQKKLYKKHRVYFSLGSKPSWYTYNLMESLMTGCPTINFGKKLGSYSHPSYRNFYNLPNVIENGVNGFCFDDKDEMVSTIKELFSNDSLAKSVSSGARALALKHFSKEDKKAQWKSLLDK